jgi:16S rRNA (adenine1518-N6/adenine1519-N6)-dimethyltransferase
VRDAAGAAPEAESLRSRPRDSEALPGRDSLEPLRSANALSNSAGAPRQPKKRFGQHFLEPAWVEKLLRAVAPGIDETFFEIGPGRGALTRPLAARCARVVAFEIDRDLAATLREEAPRHLTIVEGDFLDVTSDGLRALLLDTGSSPRVVGNLPYNVASPILFKLVDLYSAGIAVADATLMLQREVADRLVASPGTREYGVLSILIGHAAGVERLFTLPPGAFRPMPKVHSAVVRLRFHPPDPPATDPRVFAAIVQAIFTRRRKTLANALLAYPAAGGPKTGRPSLVPEVLRLADLDGRLRPETFSITELVRLADAFASVSRRAVL